MSDLFGNHIVGFPTRRLNYVHHNRMVHHFLGINPVHEENHLQKDTIHVQHGFLTQDLSISILNTGADPEFLEGGFKSIKRGFIFKVLTDFS